MTGWDWAIDFVMILLACLGAYIVERWYEKREERQLDLGCHYCEEVKHTYRSPDKHFWLCRKCMEAYLGENDFTESEKNAVRAKYRHKPPKKIMPKKKKRKPRKENL
jgi:ribosomal protein L37AE/L43A